MDRGIPMGPVGDGMMINSLQKRVDELETNYSLLSDNYKQMELSNQNLRTESARLKAEREGKK